jgi:hypothetical protein
MSALFVTVQLVHKLLPPVTQNQSNLNLPVLLSNETQWIDFITI